MPRIQIPDRQELVFSIEETLRAEFGQVQFYIGKTPGEPADLTLELDPNHPASSQSMSLKLSGGWRDAAMYSLPTQWAALKDDLRRRLDGLDARRVDAGSSSELPALGDELFTLGGIPVPREPAFTEPHEVIEDPEDHSVQNTLDPMPEPYGELPLPDDMFSLGTSERRLQAVGTSGHAEQVTAPGILRRNTIEAPADSIQPVIDDQKARGLAMSSAPFDGNMAQHLLRLHTTGFSGALEISLPQFTVRMSWENGRVGDLEGYAPILQHLLQLSGAGSAFAGDLTRTLSDPIEWAVRRQLISSEEETKWLLRCRREAIRLAITATRCPVPAEGLDFRRHLPLLDPKPLLFCGVVEHFGADLACALCDCTPPADTSVQWIPLFDDADFDPLWVRALHLLASGTPWAEACIRSGLSVAESWTLAYACRLFQLCEPTLPASLPAAEILRRRFRTLEENLRTQSSDQFFGDNAASARRVHQEILIQLASFPVPLRILLAQDIEKLKKSMDKSMSLLSL
ncbi:hypothetical protein KJ975_09370 [Myxococcota bacterium]|nr:hypothetical protein [Myxococcota bacterium]